MTDDKGRKDQGGFFDDEAEEDYLSEKTVVDSEVLFKVNAKLKSEASEPELLEEVVMETPKIPSADEQKKVEQVHELFDQGDEPDAIDDEDKTVILSDEEISGMPEQVGAKLVVVEGPVKGKEYTIEHSEIFVGRSKENDFVIDDRSISRKHFRVRRRFDEFIAIDLESGNGTRINNEKIDQAVLKHEDFITLGRTKLQFIDLAAVAATQEKDDTKALFATSVTETEPEPEPVPAPAPAAAPAPAPAPEPKQAPAPTVAPAPAASTAQPKPQQPTPQQQRFEPMSAQRPASTPKQGGMGGITIAIVAVIIIAVALILFQQMDQAGPKTESKPEPVAKTEPVGKTPPPAEQQKDVKIKKLLDEAKILMNGKFFSKASDKYNEVLAIDNANGEATVGKNQAQRELANQDALEEGRKLFDTKDFVKASIRLKAVGDSSVFHAEAQTYLNKIDDAKYDAKVEDGKKKLAKKDYDGAIGVFDGVLAERPNHGGATKYKQIAIEERDAQKVAVAKRQEEAQAKKAEEDRQRKFRAEQDQRRKREEAQAKKADEERKRREAEQAKREEERKKKEAEEAKKRKVNGMSDLDKGLGMYKNGDADKAAVELSTIAEGRGNQAAINKAKKLVASIKKFNQDFDAGSSAHRRKNAKVAIPKLKAAMRADMGIASGSVYKGKISAMLADMYYLVGNQSKQAQKWDKAYKAYSRALAFKSDHGPSKKGMEELSDQARKLYYQGYAVKDVEPDVAEKKWKTVKQIVPKSNEWYKKADAGLQDL